MSRTVDLRVSLPEGIALAESGGGGSKNFCKKET